MKPTYNIKTNKRLHVLLALTFLIAGSYSSVVAQDATLNSLDVKNYGTQLLSNFSKNTFNYVVSLQAKTDITISAVPAASKAAVDITQDGTTTYTNNSLLSINKEGDNIITVKVTSGSAVNTYTINFTTPKNTISSDFNSLNIYQVMVSSFQDGANCGYGTGWGPSNHRGDLRGIINALDYIKGLGVNALWMTPIFDSNNSNMGTLTASTGYFCTDYFNIDPNFGTLNDFKELVQKAHEKGLYVILDGVFGHHGGNVKASKTGKYPNGSSNPVSYPGSLEFYKEVASYWITNFDIDGWRLDQCYQVNQNGHNYLKEIRETVEAAAAANKANGKTWGTLGYVVGEDWSGDPSIIQKQTYSGEGLVSAFDFPNRYNIVNTIAKAESDPGGNDVTTLAKTYRTPAEMGYSNSKGLYPNIFLTNHDVWRFGNLIRAKFGYSKENNAYWRRHKMAIAAIMAYTGPTTLYYGDEIGNIADCWYGNGGACGGRTYTENCARTDGYISNFTTDEQNLHDYVAKLLSVRKSHYALWRGTNAIKLQTGNILANLKTDAATGEKILFVLNNNTTSSTAQVNCEGSSLVDLISGETISGSGTFSIPLENLSARFFIVK